VIFFSASGSRTGSPSSFADARVASALSVSPHSRSSLSQITDGRGSNRVRAPTRAAAVHFDGAGTDALLGAPAPDALRLDWIGPPEIEAYEAKNLGSHLARKTVNNDLSVLRKVLSTAVEWRLLRSVLRSSFDTRGKAST
jgi:hypothetical protein